MKYSLLLAFNIAALLASSQPVIKVYGYSQIFIPGMIFSEDALDENGKKIPPRPRFTTNYFIFIEADSSVKILAKEIWIGGKWDTVANQSLVTTPVVSEYPDKQEMVPATKKKAVQVNIGDTLRRNVYRSATVKKWMKENELIIVYWWKGKKYYVRLKKLTELPPVHGV